MERQNIDLSTDSHLAKKYNDLLYDCMLRCNTTGFVNNSAQHYNNLLSYYGAINMLYINTFMLFETINFNIAEEDGKFKTVSSKLKDWSNEIEEDIQLMKTNSQFQKVEYFLRTFDKCKNVHKLIMYGLQRLNMLVRMSQKEPTGEKSIDYWSTKTAFKKGAIKGDQGISKGGWK